MSHLEYCIDKAKQIPYVKGRARHFAAVFDKRGRLVTESANSYLKTSPRSFKAACKVGLDEKCYLHAEQRALYLDKSRRGVKLVVARVGARDAGLNSEPCVVCKEILKDFNNIKSVEFTL